MNPIKVGIIGFGRSGCGIHADAIAQQQEKFTVVAICDELPDRRTHEAFPQAKPYAEAAALIAERMRFFWVGFYRVSGSELVLGPFQGPAACLRRITFRLLFSP